MKKLWARIARAVSWTRPTSTEIGVVAKSALAAGLAWFVADLVTEVAAPVLAPLTALVVVQVSVRASMKAALQRSLAVVLGVLGALAIGDALDLNAVTVALIVAVSLGISQLVMRLPAGAARQVPISALVVLAAVSTSQQSEGWHRAIDTVLGAAVGVIVSLVLPASRLVDARQTLKRLGDSLCDVLIAMGEGLQETWSTEQTAEWRRQARTTRDRLVAQTTEAIGSGRDAARWNVRDRRHVEQLGRYEQVLPRLERTAIGVSVISRGLDDHAHLSGETHRPMPSMGDLFVALARAIEALVRSVLGEQAQTELELALSDVSDHRKVCLDAASRRARTAIEGTPLDGEEHVEGEWLNYVALLVQVDRVVADLNAPLPD